LPGPSFQRVPEPKTVKNRVHLDLVVDDVDAATSRIEGNDFCLIYGGRPDS